MLSTIWVDLICHDKSKQTNNTLSFRRILNHTEVSKKCNCGAVNNTNRSDPNLVKGLEKDMRNRESWDRAAGEIEVRKSGTGKNLGLGEIGMGLMLLWLLWKGRAKEGKRESKKYGFCGEWPAYCHAPSQILSSSLHFTGEQQPSLSFPVSPKAHCGLRAATVFSSFLRESPVSKAFTDNQNSGPSVQNLMFWIEGYKKIKLWSSTVGHGI